MLLILLGGFGLTAMLLSCASRAQTSSTMAHNERHAISPLDSAIGNMAVNLETLGTLSRKQRRSVVRQTKNTQKMFVSLLEDDLYSKDHDVQCYAVFLLGENRVAESASKLAGMIMLEDIVYRGDNPDARMGSYHPWWWTRYPVFDALVKIGEPSVDPALNNLRKQTDKRVRVYSLYLIYSVTGRDKDTLLDILQVALNKETDLECRANLGDAITYINSHDPALLLKH